MSPSAWQRGLTHGIFYTLNYLAHLEAKGVRVVNGYRSFAHEISKAQQLTNLEKLGLPYPKAHVINHPAQALAAAEAIGYPVVLKPNIGGSGAGIERFSSPEQLRAAVDASRLYFGIDSTALVQEAFTRGTESSRALKSLVANTSTPFESTSPARRSTCVPRTFARTRGARS